MSEHAILLTAEPVHGLEVGTVLFPALDSENSPIDEPHVIIFADSGSDRLFAVNLQRDIRPSIFSYSEVLICIEENNILTGRLALPSYMSVPESFIPVSQRNKRDRKMESIKPIIENLEEYVVDSYGKGIIRNVLKKHKSSKATLHRDLNRYFRFGCNANAFLRKPGSGKVTNRVYTAKPGPNNGSGRVRTDKDIANVHTAIRKFYAKTGPQMYLDTVYQKCLDHFYSDHVYNAEKGRVEYIRWHESRLITEWQFRDMARAYRKKNKHKIIKAQGRSAEYAKNEKPSEGTLHNFYDKGPGYYYQIDETPFDVELVCQFDPKRIKRVGKPTLYTVRDMSTRAFVGLYITFKNSSADTARAIAFNTFRNKQKFCSELGIYIGDKDWLMQSKCRNLFCDNAEMAAELSRCFSKDAHITVHYNKEGHSNEKGLVERGFRLLHDAVNGQVDGYSPNNIPAHIKKILRHKALLNINELYQILITYIIIYNNYSINEEIHLSKAMHMDGVRQIPSQAWEWGVKNNAGYLKHVEEFELYQNLLEVGEVTCLPTHLSLAGFRLKYMCSWTKDNNYQKKGGVSPKLNCRYMRHSMDVIFIETPDGFKAATLIGQLFQHVSMEEIKSEEKIIHEGNVELKKLHKEKQGETRGLIEHLQSNARKEQEKINVNQANTQNIKSNRNEEIEHEVMKDKLRHEEFLVQGHGLIPVSEKRESNVQQQSAASSARGDRIREMREQRKNRGNTNAN